MAQRKVDKNGEKKSSFKFIDLFAGLGGFHLALSAIGGKCVFASELRDDLRRIYKQNFGIEIQGDITKIDPKKDIPSHNVLCGGFPCQPFSQAGKREGFNDVRGTMFDYICKIIEVHKPEYLFLENVANLKGHDKGNTWKVIQDKLDALGYNVTAEILSPHQFGIPQHRKRIYIVGQRKDFGDFNEFSFPVPTNLECNIKSIIDESDSDVTLLRHDTKNQLNVWQEFLDKASSRGGKIPGFPIWAMEFGANYDFKEVAPAYQELNNLIGKRGRLGCRVFGQTVADCLKLLPNYAQTAKNKEFPTWKKRYISQNREFYEINKDWLSEWMGKIRYFDNSHLKLEWNCGNVAPIISDKIVQFRASGIRIKNPTFSPALNLVGTQIPIFPWVAIPGKDDYGRYMSVQEAAKLQGMQKLKFGSKEFELSKTRIYEALGNAVNVQLVKKIAKRLIRL
ncbi:MAG: DNA cytosine methyltransferase [Fibrobacter sp.]|uniref:DNA cytosine methyltransferase n=1 Tax=Fibrobacter sp. TaxID=35828 RepID=UPI0025C6C4B0|nr:DNA cytosine methyltransferase [Fibrobacter sp.]MBQ7080043.1 DNA cytosine methyltransferase [Fibrobacter sp.]